MTEIQSFRCFRKKLRPSYVVAISVQETQFFATPAVDGGPLRMCVAAIQTSPELDPHPTNKFQVIDV